MNIRDAILEGKRTNKAIRRKSWTDLACIYHRVDNVFYWFCTDTQCDIPNHSHFTFCVAALEADDWAVSDLASYHGDDVQPVPDKRVSTPEQGHAHVVYTHT